MLDLNQYIQSGIIEDYCLGLASDDDGAQLLEYAQQYPEVKQALEIAEQNLEQLLWQHAQKAPEGNLSKILEGIEASTLEKAQLTGPKAQLEKFIPIFEKSDHQQWQRLTQNLEVPTAFNLHLHELYHDDRDVLYVVWIKDRIPQEEHQDLAESILCLEGHCVGKLAGKEIQLHPGSFWSVPLNTVHSLEVVSPDPVKLILMRRKVV